MASISTDNEMEDYQIQAGFLVTRCMRTCTWRGRAAQPGQATMQNVVLEFALLAAERAK